MAETLSRRNPPACLSSLRARSLAIAHIALFSLDSYVCRKVTAAPLISYRYRPASAVQVATFDRPSSHSPTRAGALSSSRRS